MGNNKTARQNIDIMLSNDHFSKWLGIELIDLKIGYCKIRMKIKKEMLNGFGIVHGGILFSFADSAFAFASNGNGRISVALDTSISFTKSVKLDEIIFAEAKEQYSGYKTGLYWLK